MIRKTFTNEQIKKLSENKNISHCGGKVRYTKAFKQFAIRQYNEGLSAVEIFQNAGIDLAVIGKYSPNHLMSQWRKALRAEPDQASKILNSPRSDLERLKSQVAYLKAENHFLAQLQAKKKRN